MTPRATDAPYDGGAWSALSNRLAPYLDLALGTVAASLSVVSVLATDVDTIDPRLQPADLVSVAATAVAGLSLVWRRTRPVTSFCAFLAGCLVVTLTDHYIGLLSVLLLFSLYSLAAHGARRLHGVVGLGVGVLVFVALALLDVPDLGTSDLVQACALLLAAWALGDAIRSRRAQQAQRLRVAEQELVTAREHAARAVVEERLRIARELHDVVAHSMSLIAVQAGVGAHVIRTDVAAAEHALDVIGDTSRKALTQTRSMLGLLRDEDARHTEPPSQSIADLGDLVADVREAGVDVTLTTGGRPRPLGAGVELTAYRIVQESLTNVIKHSGATRAVVELAYVEDGLDIEVQDRGGPPGRSTRPAPSGGHGLTGLHERARILGGALEYGALGDGFRVHAHLPAEQVAP
jgi:signal transduction histidine kinase